MSSTPVILFDVDNTIVKKNLLFSFLSTFALLYPKSALKLGNILTPAFYALRSALSIKQEEFFYHKDLTRLDKQSVLIYEDFFKHFKNCCKKLGLTDNHIAYHTENSVYQYDVKQMLYPEALAHLKTALANPANSIYLLSANLEELIVPFFLLLTQSLETTPDQRKRVHYAGSHINEKSDSYDVCVGSRKVITLEKMLVGVDNPIIMEAYSDNHYFTDLPMLMRAQDQRVIVDEQNALYDELSAILPTSFIFRPRWKKPSS